MSLINEMLRDLDSKNYPGNLAIPVGLRVDSTQKNVNATNILFKAILFVLSLIFVFVLMDWLKDKVFVNSTRHLISATQIETKNPPFVEVKLSQDALESINATQIFSLSEALPSINTLQSNAESVNFAAMQDITPKQTEAEELHILLQAAENALLEQRFTTPKNDNAFQYFTSVLMLEPNNAIALDGIKTMQNAYLTWVKSALDKSDAAAAQRYLSRAKLVGVDAEMLAPYYTRVEEINTSFDASKELNQVDLSTPAHSSNSLVITTNSSVKDQDLVKELRIKGLNMQGRMMVLLDKSAVDLPQSTIVFADLLARNQLWQPLKYLHTLVQINNLNTQFYIGALLDMQSGSHDSAVLKLESIAYEGNAELQRLRSLAGLFQHQKKYARSLQIYETLVSVETNNANDWLGLAVSADGVGDTQKALDAYQKMLKIGHANPSVMQFAQKKISTLTLSR